MNVGSMFQNIPAELTSLKQWVSFIDSRCYYWPVSGEVFYKPQIFVNPSPRQKQWNVRYAHKKTGHLNTNGYLRVSFGPDVQEFYIHQIAFAIMKGYIPLEVDHEDKNKLNNSWGNLRDIAHSDNMKNVFKRYDNSSGYKGVSWSKWSKCWRMDITSNGIRYHSYHLTKEEAYQAYCLKSAELHKDYGCAE